MRIGLPFFAIPLSEANESSDSYGHGQGNPKPSKCLASQEIGEATRPPTTNNDGYRDSYGQADIECALAPHKPSHSELLHFLPLRIRGHDDVQ